MGITAFILCIVTLTKGLKHIGLHLNGFEVFLISLVIGIISIVVCYFYFRSPNFIQKVQRGTFGGVESIQYSNASDSLCYGIRTWF